MRIAIDARAAAEVPAGRGRYVRELIRGLGRLEADHAFILHAREPWVEPNLNGRFSWRTYPAPAPSWPLIAGWRMSRAADVGLACTSFAMTAAWRIPGAAIVWDFAPFDRRFQTPRGSLLERLTLPVALRRCAVLITISEAVRSELLERFPDPAPNLVVAPPAADQRFAPAPEASDAAVLARNGLVKPYVLALGTLEPRKNLPRLIAAFAGLEDDVRGERKLVLVGAPGWQTRPTFSAVAAHSDLVKTLGWVPDEDLPCLYRHAELFCYVSMYEGFGIPVLEAMQSGTAVLTSSTASMPEVGGDAARYTDPFSVPAIQTALRELLSDPELRRRCEEAGIRRATTFSWDRTARSVLAALEQAYTRSAEAAH